MPLCADHSTTPESDDYEDTVETSAVRPPRGGRGLRRGRPDHAVFGRQLRRPAIQRRPPVSNFARTPFNDRISSAVVHEGRWEICLDSEYRGGCSVLGPGAYPNLGAYSNRISSIRPLDGRYADGRYDGRYDRNYPDRYRDARAILYEGPNMSGRAFPIQDAVANLAGPASTTARLRCASKAATGSSAATPSSAANAARSDRANTPTCRASTTQSRRAGGSRTTILTPTDPIGGTTIAHRKAR